MVRHMLPQMIRLLVRQVGRRLLLPMLRGSLQLKSRRMAQQVGLAEKVMTLTIYTWTRILVFRVRL